MKKSILVAVSPNYNGRGWTDFGTGTSFEPQKTLYPIRITYDDTTNLSGIANSIRMNNLLLLEGSLPKMSTVDESAVNPEELDKQAFDKLVKRLKGQKDDANLHAIIARLTEENKALKAEISVLKDIKKATSTVVEKATEAPVEEVSAVSEAVLPEEEALKSLTISELKTMAEEKGIEIKASDKKAQIISKLMSAE